MPITTSITIALHPIEHELLDSVATRLQREIDEARIAAAESGADREIGYDPDVMLETATGVFPLHEIDYLLQLLGRATRF